MFQFVLKVISASVAISFAIKYIGPLLQIPVNSAIALMVVLLPPIILGGFLIWRGLNPPQTQPNLNFQQSGSRNREPGTEGN